jgi:hypothetical protein
LALGKIFREETPRGRMAGNGLRQKLRGLAQRRERVGDASDQGQQKD